MRDCFLSRLQKALFCGLVALCSSAAQAEPSCSSVFAGVPMTSRSASDFGPSWVRTPFEFSFDEQKAISDLVAMRLTAEEMSGENLGGLSDILDADFQSTYEVAKARGMNEQKYLSALARGREERLRRESSAERATQLSYQAAKAKEKRLLPWSETHALTGLNEKDSINSVAISSDGTKAVVGSDQGAQLWDLTTGKPIAELQGHTERVQTVAISPDGRRAITTSRDGLLIVWNIDALEPVKVDITHGKTITLIEFTPDGSKFLTSSQDDSTLIWDTQTGKREWRLWGHSKRVLSIAFSQDGQWMATGSKDNTAIVWNTKNWRLVKKLGVHLALVNRVVFHPDGQRVITSSEDARVRVWNFRQEKVEHTIWASEFALSKSRLGSSDPDGEFLFTHRSFERPKIWNLDTGEPERIFETKGPLMRHPAYVDNGSLIRVISMDQILFLDASSGDVVRSIRHPEKLEFDETLFRTNGATILADAKAPRRIRVWEQVD